MNEKWTYSDIPSQEGKVAIVTGANSGLGYYTAKGLAERQCEVVMACRDIAKAEKAKKEMVKAQPDLKLVIMKLDLADLSSVKSFADQFTTRFEKLNILVNNAGLMAIPRRLTKDGFEMQFGVNHLGHFALTGLLFNMIRSTPGSRVVNVSSAAHKIGTIRFDDIHWEDNYKKWKAYGMSKLANIHFTHEMADRVSMAAMDIRVVAAHPGYSDSNLIGKGPEMNGRQLLVKFGKILNRIFAQSTAMGALPSLYAATSPDAEHRGYYGPGGFAEIRGYPKRAFPSRKKLSKDVQERLWELSEKLTGVKYLVER